MIYLFCNRKSEAVYDLKAALRERGVECLRINEYHGQRFQHGPFINWGCGEHAPPANMVGPTAEKENPYWNRPHAVLTSCSKIRTYRAMIEADVWTVAMTQDREYAATWLKKERTVLAREDWGSNGNGITVVKPGEALPPAPFYSRYFPCTNEFRAHVAFGKAIDFVERIKRSTKEHNPYVRSFANGWRLSHEGPEVDKKWQKEMEDLSVAAIAACGLDFGAVDILANLDPKFNGQRFLVCETNSAPALELEATIDAYANAFASHEKV